MELDVALRELPIVAILRGVRPTEVLDHVAALEAAGVRAVEIPLNSPEPLSSLRAVVAAFGDRMTVGAGTVLSPEQVDAVAEAGGRLIVSPNTNPKVIARARGLGLEPAPGFATATEAFVALEAGARHLKLFPAASYGVDHVKQLKAVLPVEAVVWGVGGVGAADLGSWWSTGVRAFGIGSDLYRAGQDVAQTVSKAREFVAAARRTSLGRP